MRARAPFNTNWSIKCWMELGFAISLNLNKPLKEAIENCIKAFSIELSVLSYADIGGVHIELIHLIRMLIAWCDDSKSEIEFCIWLNEFEYGLSLVAVGLLRQTCQSVFFVRGLLWIRYKCSKKRCRIQLTRCNMCLVPFYGILNSRKEKNAITVFPFMHRYTRRYWYLWILCIVSRRRSIANWQTNFCTSERRTNLNIQSKAIFDCRRLVNFHAKRFRALIRHSPCRPHAFPTRAHTIRATTEF